MNSRKIKRYSSIFRLFPTTPYLPFSRLTSYNVVPLKSKNENSQLREEIVYEITVSETSGKEKALRAYKDKLGKHGIFSVYVAELHGRQLREPAILAVVEPQGVAELLKHVSKEIDDTLSTPSSSKH